MKIGFVGLGNMGGRLASRLADVGDLTVYDVYEPFREAFRDRARVAASIAEAGARADVVGLCVRTGEHVIQQPHVAHGPGERANDLEIDRRGRKPVPARNPSG